MGLVLVTPPTSEPLSRAEARAHLRLDVSEYTLVKTASISPGAYTTDASGSAVDIAGSQASLFFDIGTITAPTRIAAVVQDSTNGSTWTAIAGSSVWTKSGTTATASQFSSSDSDNTYEQSYEGDKQYVRCAVSFSTGNAAEFGLSVAEQTLATDESSLLDALITAARERAEATQRRALLSQTWRLSLDDWRDPHYHHSGNGFEYLHLPLPKLQSVSSITYVDTDGTTTTWPSSDYTVDTESEPGRVGPIYGGTWPAARLQPAAIKITFVAGATSTTDIPQATRQAMKLMVGHWYENREEVNVGNIVTPMPMGAELLLSHGKWGSYV